MCGIPSRALPWKSGLLVICLSVLLIGCDSGGADQGESETSAGGAANGGGAGVQFPPHTDEIEIINVPETGISLGWGWNSFDNQTIPSICVEFVEGNEPAQTQSVDIKEVTDNYEVMQHVGGSAEGSYSGFGVEVSGSASFARDVNINNSSTNFLLTANVQNGVRYAAPVPAADAVALAGVELVTPRGGNSGEVRLTPAALALAKLRNISRFQQACGDSFVSAVYGGAKLTAVISIQAKSRAEKQKMSASVQGSGWGATLSASADKTDDSKSESKNSSVAVLLTGGRNESIPTSVEEVVAMSKRLAIAAYEAPKDFHMAITPYENLPNWPGREMLGPETVYDQLADRWGFYISLYDEIQDVLDNPQRYRWQEEGTSKTGTAEFPTEHAQHLLALQDEIVLIIKALGQDAQRCSAAGEDLSDSLECDFDPLRYPDPYRYRVQLPPPLFPPPDTDPVDPAESTVDLVTDTLQQQVIHKAKLRCQLDVNNLSCLTNAEITELATLIGQQVSPLRETLRPTAWLLEP